jgi:hypothetical protein
MENTYVQKQHNAASVGRTPTEEDAMTLSGYGHRSVRGRFALRTDARPPLALATTHRPAADRGDTSCRTD